MQPCKPSTSKAMLGQAKRSESCKASAQQASLASAAQRASSAQLGKCRLRLGNKKAPELIVSLGAFCINRNQNKLD